MHKLPRKIHIICITIFS
jgi:molecular chaperone DnaK